MNRSKLLVGALATSIAASSAANAAFSTPVPEDQASAGNTFVLSSAAKDQALKRGEMNLARSRGGWVQLGNPWIQWKGQIKSPRLQNQPGPDVDVLSTFNSIV